jgi:hypothetical protein
MNGLASRLQRIERKVGPTDPFASLSDDELDAAIATVKASIEAGTGISEPALADRFENDLASGENGYNVDPQVMRCFVDQVKREYRHDA